MFPPTPSLTQVGTFHIPHPTLLQFINKKDRKVSLIFNDELLELFKISCAQENIKIAHTLESLMINFIEENVYY